MFHLEHGLDALIPWLDATVGDSGGPRAIPHENARGQYVAAEGARRRHARATSRESPGSMQRTSAASAISPERNRPLLPAPALDAGFVTAHGTAGGGGCGILSRACSARSGASSDDRQQSHPQTATMLPLRSPDLFRQCRRRDAAAGPQPRRRAADPGRRLRRGRHLRHRHGGGRDGLGTGPAAADRAGADGRRRTVPGRAAGLPAAARLRWRGWSSWPSPGQRRGFMGVPEAAWAYRILAFMPLVRAFTHFDIWRLNRQMVFWPLGADRGGAAAALAARALAAGVAVRRLAGDALGDRGRRSR